MKEKLRGDFEYALNNLLRELCLMRDGRSKKSITGALIDFDSDRGHDWFIDTRGRKEIRECAELERLKSIYED